MLVSILRLVDYAWIFCYRIGNLQWTYDYCHYYNTAALLDKLKFSVKMETTLLTFLVGESGRSLINLAILLTKIF